MNKRSELHASKMHKLSRAMFSTVFDPLQTRMPDSAADRAIISLKKIRDDTDDSRIRDAIVHIQNAKMRVGANHIASLRLAALKLEDKRKLGAQLVMSHIAEGVGKLTRLPLRLSER
jgi:hypothetical protein